MKKLFIILASIFGLLLVSAFAIPFFFKDKIQAKVNELIAQKVDANVYYNNFGLSLFKNFPTLTLSLTDFGVVGNSPFVGDTLVQAKSFDVSLDIQSVIAGGEIAVHHIGLDVPKIKVKVLKDGTANYDIYKADTTTSTTAPAEKSNFKVGINSWEINDGSIVYNDLKDDTYASFTGINHEGKGDISSDVYDLVTKTSIEQANVKFKGADYLHDKTLAADLDMNINQATKKYTFRNNKVTLNDFVLNLDGFVSMPDTNNIVMNLKYNAPESEFKQLLSLVPNIYTEKFKDLKAEGKVAFDGTVNGTYNNHSMPAFGFNLMVENGMFQYPDLPAAVTGINIDFKASNTTNKLANTVLDIRKFNLNFGQNPVTAKALIQGLNPSKVNADVAAKLDLQQLAQMFPMDGLVMKGLYAINLKANGVYDSTTKQFPKVNALMSLANGYIKSDKFPEPIQNLNIKASLVNTNGALASTVLTVSDFRMLLQNEPFQATGIIKDFANYNWDIKAKGKVDLTKITKIYPLKDMTLKGKIDADIETKGKMSDVTAKRYSNLPTSGKASLQGFEFVSKEYPQGVKINHADMTFTPQAINVSNANGYLGTSDFVANGTISNYIGYALNNETVKGKMNVTSKKFNVNEWMTDSPTPATGGAAQPMQVVEIPKNIDFEMNSTVGEVIYDKMPLTNLKGALVVGNGAVKMKNVSFNSLGGSFTTNGTYSTTDIAHPTFDFAMNLENIGISEAYKNLTVVKYLMPIAQYMVGNVTSKIKIDGELGQDMMPKIQSLNADGLIKLLKASIQDNPLMEKLASTTQLTKFKNMQLNDVLMQVEIQDGRFGVKPFDIKLNDNSKVTVGGHHGIDGGMDYALALDVPAGKAGEAFGSIFTKWTGKAIQGTDRVKVDLAVGGTMKSPTFAFKGSSTAAGLKDAVTSEAKAQVDAIKAKATQEVDKLKKDAEARVQAEKERLINEANAKKAELENRIQQERAAIEARAKAAADSLKKAASDRAKKMVEEQKNKLLDGFFKKK